MPSAWEAIVARPAPTRPSLGRPSPPKISTALRPIFAAVTTPAISIGSRVLRSARSALSSVIETARKTVESRIRIRYGTACSITAGSAPRLRRVQRGAARMIARKSSDAASATISDAASATRAPGRSPAPIARAISATQEVPIAKSTACASWKNCEA